MPFNQDTYRKWILPALGVAETIATKGKSLGTLALSQEQIFRDVEESALKKKQIEAQIAEQQAMAQERALQGQLTPFQIAAAQRNQRRGSEEDAARSALKKGLGLRYSGASDAPNDAQLESLYFGAYPDKLGEKFKPAATQLFVDENGNPVSVLKSNGLTSEGKQVKVRTPPAPKSLETIEAEAKARAQGATEGAGSKPLSGDAAKLSGYVSTLETQGQILKGLIQSHGIRWVTKEYKLGNPAVVNVIEDAADAKGRLRSGGAVNDQEAKRFKQPFTGIGNVLYGDNEAALAAIDQVLTEASQVKSGMGKGAGQQNNDPLGLGF